MSHARKLRRAHVKRPRMVMAEARRAGLKLPVALALLEKETGIPQRNIFGCDYGPQGGRLPFCGEYVTRSRVKALLKSHYANGVGWTQLTYRPFVEQAEAMGGAHKPRYQMRVAFKILRDLIQANGTQTGFARYNGSGPAAEQYGRDAIGLARKWEIWLGE